LGTNGDKACRGHLLKGRGGSMRRRRGRRGGGAGQCAEGGGATLSTWPFSHMI